MSRDNLEVVELLVDAFNAQDADAACAVLDDDVQWWPAYTGGGALEGAVYRGHAGFVRYLADLSQTWREIEGYIDDLRMAGDRALLIARIRFVGASSGVEMVQPISGVFKFRHGKIAVAHYYVDRADALAAVGLRE